ncbi:MAG: hypothetical protein JWQ44_2631, partial [Chthoniobacter sp.]|nr:hypothetical protein [Chthoniobacter sp.]
VMEGALSLARERLSFGYIAGELEKFFARLAR